VRRSGCGGGSSGSGPCAGPAIGSWRPAAWQRCAASCRLAARPQHPDLRHRAGLAAGIRQRPGRCPQRPGLAGLDPCLRRPDRSQPPAPGMPQTSGSAGWSRAAGVLCCRYRVLPVSGTTRRGAVTRVPHEHDADVSRGAYAALPVRRWRRSGTARRRTGSSLDLSQIRRANASPRPTPGTLGQTTIASSQSTTDRHQASSRGTAR
jgi:hypothetical protein